MPKQLEAVGPAGESLLDYGIHDALAAGAGRLIVVTRPALQDALRDHVHQRWPGVPNTIVLQPSAATDTWRPGGTGHAVLAAEELLDGPFVVANADDFYGRPAWETVVTFLRNAGAGHALVGFPVRDTLSPSGGVSRAVCTLSPAGDLMGLEELRDVRADEGKVTGVDGAGRRIPVAHDARVSMNLWGFRPGLLPALRQVLARRGGDAEAGEFYLSSAVESLRRSGTLDLRVLPTTSAWCGLTHPEDRPNVQAHLRRVTGEGAYPARLGSTS